MIKSERSILHILVKIGTTTIAALVLFVSCNKPIDDNPEKVEIKTDTLKILGMTDLSRISQIKDHIAKDKTYALASFQQGAEIPVKSADWNELLPFLETILGGAPKVKFDINNAKLVSGEANQVLSAAQCDLLIKLVSKNLSFGKSSTTGEYFNVTYENLLKFQEHLRKLLMLNGIPQIIVKNGSEVTAKYNEALALAQSGQKNQLIFGDQANKKVTLSLEDLAVFENYHENMQILVAPGAKVEVLATQEVIHKATLNKLYKHFNSGFTFDLVMSDIDNQYIEANDSTYFVLRTDVVKDKETGVLNVVDKNGNLSDPYFSRAYPAADYNAAVAAGVNLVPLDVERLYATIETDAARKTYGSGSYWMVARSYDKHNPDGSNTYKIHAKDGSVSLILPQNSQYSNNYLAMGENSTYTNIMFKDFIQGTNTPYMFCILGVPQKKNGTVRLDSGSCMGFAEVGTTIHSMIFYNAGNLDGTGREMRNILTTYGFIVGSTVRLSAQYAPTDCKGEILPLGRGQGPLPPTKSIGYN